MLNFIVPRHCVKYTFKEYRTIFDYLFLDKVPTCDGSFEEFVSSNLKKDTFYGISLRVLFFHVLKYFKNNKSDKNGSILFPEYSFPALVNSAKKAGYKIYFYKVDLNLETDIRSLERLCSNVEPEIIVLSQHFGNIDKNSEKIRQISRKHDSILLEDCAHSFSNLKSFGDVSFYSFGTGKDVVACGGGMIAYDSHKFKDLKKYLDNIKKEPSKEIVSEYLKEYLTEILFSSFPLYHFFVFPILYIFSIINRKIMEKFMEVDDSGFSEELYSMPDVMFRLLELNLAVSKKWWKNRIILGTMYRKGIGENILPTRSYLVVPLVLGDADTKFDVSERLMKRFIDVRMDYLKFYLPHPLDGRIIYLPSHPYINKKQVRKIIKIIKRKA